MQSLPTRMNTTLNLLIALCLASALGQTSPATAQPPALAPAVAQSDGEVRKVDREAGTLTLRHGPLTNLGMEGMTMVFRVADPGMLDRVSQGDKVRFVAD